MASIKEVGAGIASLFSRGRSKGRPSRGAEDLDASAESRAEDASRSSILDHYRNPRNQGVVENPSVQARGKNPLCGDEVDLSLRLAPDGALIDAISFTSRGCSIVQASASMMTELVQGRTAEAAGVVASDVLNRLTRPGAPSNELPAEIEALKLSVRDYPSRVKCAVLPWTTLSEAVGKAGKPSTSPASREGVPKSG